MATDYLAEDTARGAADVPQQAPAFARLRSATADSTIRMLLAGGVAGCVSKTVTAPLARLTILYQVQTTNHVPGWSGSQSLSIREALSHVARTEGVLALWKGNGVTVVHRLPYSAINFFTYESLLKRLSGVGFDDAGTPGDGPVATAAGVRHRLAAGAGAGMVACAATYPLDLVRTRLATQTTHVKYTGMRHALRSIYAEEGVLGLYRGLGATLIGVAPSLAINFAAYDILRRQVTKTAPNAPPAVLALVAGSAAGAVSAVSCFPLDLVRRRMQMADSPNSSGGQRGRSGPLGRMLDVAADVVRRDGMRGFYRGIVPELAKVVPGVGIAFSVYEAIKKHLSCDP